MKPVIAISDSTKKKSIVFEGIGKCAKYFKTSESVITYHINKGDYYKGFYFDYYFGLDELKETKEGEL